MEFRDLLLMNLASWLFHPGYSREGAKAPSLTELIEFVERVDALRSERWQ